MVSLVMQGRKYRGFQGKGQLGNDASNAAAAKGTKRESSISTSPRYLYLRPPFRAIIFFGWHFEMEERGHSI